MIHFDGPFLTLGWDETTHAVWLHWKNFAAGAAFREGIDRGLELTQLKHAKSWLADATELGALTQPDRVWMGKNWLPKASAMGLERVATVVPRSTVAQYTVIPSPTSDLRGLELRYFSSLELARSWLRGELDSAKQLRAIS